MDFVHQIWKVEKLISLFTTNQLDLSPGYQRNIIWSSNAQKELLESIFRGRPMPSFFFRALADGKFEVVDGQQRARTLIGFFLGQIETFQGHFYAALPQADPNPRNQFLNYELSVTIISNLAADERIAT